MSWAPGVGGVSGVLVSGVDWAPILVVGRLVDLDHVVFFSWLGSWQVVYFL